MDETNKCSCNKELVKLLCEKLKAYAFEKWQKTPAWDSKYQTQLEEFEIILVDNPQYGPFIQVNSGMSGISFSMDGQYVKELMKQVKDFFEADEKTKQENFLKRFHEILTSKQESSDAQ